MGCLACLALHVSDVNMWLYQMLYEEAENVIHPVGIQVARIAWKHAVWISAARGRMSTRDYSHEHVTTLCYYPLWLVLVYVTMLWLV